MILGDPDAAIARRAQDVIFEQYLVERTLPPEQQRRYGFQAHVDAPRLKASIAAAAARHEPLFTPDLIIYATSRGLPDEAAFLQILGWANDPDPQLANPARAAVHELLSPNTLYLSRRAKPLVRALILGELRDRPEARAAALEVVLRNRSDFASPELMALVPHLFADEHLRAATAKLLARVPDTSLRPLVQRAIADVNPAVPLAFLESLSRDPSEWFRATWGWLEKPLRDRLQSLDGELRAEAWQDLAIELGRRIERPGGAFTMFAAQERHPIVPCGVGVGVIQQAEADERTAAEIFGGDLFRERENAAQEARRVRLEERRRKILALRDEWKDLHPTP